MILTIVICAAVYLLLSSFFLCFPGVLHKRKGAQDGPKLHSAHRGGSAECVENTLPAFRNAVRQGSELLELDVHLTRDKQVVVNHDLELSRQCGVRVQVSSLDYAELPRYLHPNKLALPPQFYPPDAVLGTSAGYLGTDGPFGATKGDAGRMPLLDEVFTEFPDVWINIDIKALPEHGAAELTRRTHALIVKHGRQARTVWGSSKGATADGCYALDPTIPLVFTTRRVLLLLLLFYTGLLPFVALRESFLEVPLLTATDLALDASFRPKRAYAAVGWLLRSRTLFWHLRRRGMATWAWVYNSGEAYDRAFALGVDGVMTDRPTHLRRYLDHRAAKAKAPGGRGGGDGLKGVSVSHHYRRRNCKVCK